jgi:non-specific serine/threonine protein kinase
MQGQVCFHLAENKQDEDYPFAFLASYATQNNTRWQYQPLQKALQHYAGDENKTALAELLQPVHAACHACEWVRELVDSGDIYHPLAWRPNEAYRLLKSASTLTDCGIIVKLPNWWQTRSRPKVQMTIGNTSNAAFGRDAILDFNMDVALGDQTLTEDEMAALLADNDSLVWFKGQWVEVDHEKIHAAMEQFNAVKAASAEGLSFIEGMRMLSGMKPDMSDNQAADIQTQDWSEVIAGKSLQSMLRTLRDPQHLATCTPGKALNATLRPYQQVGVDWLCFLTDLGLGACLADDMGLGKTIQMISLLLILQQRTETHCSVIVVPASLLANWQEECQRFAPSLTIHTIHPSASLSLRRDGIDVVLTTYGMLRRCDELLAIDWSLIIIDEAQAIKNPSAAQTQLVKQLKGRARVALTGTPVENRLGDLWSLFDFICPGLLGNSATFKKFLKKLNAGASYAPLKQLVQPYLLRRVKTDPTIIDDLPDKTEMDVWCQLSRQQVSLYADWVRRLGQALKQESGIKKRGLVLSSLMRFKQICNHPSQLTDNGDFLPSHSGKFERLGELCETIADNDEKVLVFTQFREMVKPLEKFLTTVFGSEGLTIDGSTPVKKRQARVAQFQKNQVHLSLFFP